MFKMLIVDDEEIEREGMARFIPWSKYGIELVGTAWNGVDGFEQIQSKQPDIVLTDIKMPVMNGIELIKKTKESFPGIRFIVLSGYGEFEYTSKAMEQGIRYYVLKPCDEKRIMEVVEKVKAEITEAREKKQEENDYYFTVRRLLPRAREEIFRNMLLGREQIPKENDFFLKEIGNEQIKIQLLALHNMDKGFDSVEQFILENVLTELLGEKKILLSTTIQNNILFLMEQSEDEKIKLAVERARKEYRRVQAYPVYAAVSREGTIREVRELYGQIRELFHIEELDRTIDYLKYGQLGEMQCLEKNIFDYQALKKAEKYSDILFEVYLAFVKMKMKQYNMKQIREVCRLTMKNIFESTGRGIRKLDLEQFEEEWELFKYIADLVEERKQMGNPGREKEQERMKQILQAVYQNLTNTNLSIQYLAKEILYMNEDYFGRFFYRQQNIKFSSYLLEVRINMAMRILAYAPEIRIADLAELVGYASDGQYFSKMFRKTAGMTPTEYRDMLRQKKA